MSVDAAPDRPRRTVLLGRLAVVAGAVGVCCALVLLVRAEDARSTASAGVLALLGVSSILNGLARRRSVRVRLAGVVVSAAAVVVAAVGLLVL